MERKKKEKEEKGPSGEKRGRKEGARGEKKMRKIKKKNLDQSLLKSHCHI